MAAGVPAPVLAARAPARAGPWAATARQAPGRAGPGRRHLAGPPPAPAPVPTGAWRRLAGPAGRGGGAREGVS